MGNCRARPRRAHFPARAAADLYVCSAHKHAAAAGRQRRSHCTGHGWMDERTPPRPPQTAEYCAESREVLANARRRTRRGDNAPCDAARLFPSASSGSSSPVRDLIHIPRALTFFWIVNSFTCPVSAGASARGVVRTRRITGTKSARRRCDDGMTAMHINERPPRNMRRRRRWRQRDEE